MGWSAEALSALCHALLVCLSEHCYGDRRPQQLVKQSICYVYTYIYQITKATT